MFANGPLNVRSIGGAIWQQLLSEPFVSKVSFQVFYFDVQLLPQEHNILFTFGQSEETSAQ